MISTYPEKMIKRLEDRIKELEDEVVKLNGELFDKEQHLDDLYFRMSLMRD